MAYNQELANRVQSAFQLFPTEITNALTQKKMFGGLSFLFHGKMTVGIVKEDLAVRVVSDKMKEVLQQDAVRPMDFTKRPMKEFIYVSPQGFETEEQLNHWIELGVEHAKSKL
ncbi:MAG: hypothetical protein COA50_15790 [Flavobacteriaceae bacterium]|nr:MAG: hypothetical protein COA50_15790 [Flavobacteriaceae bacterium]